MIKEIPFHIILQAVCGYIATFAAPHLQTILRWYYEFRVSSTYATGFPVSLLIADKDTPLTYDCHEGSEIFWISSQSWQAIREAMSTGLPMLVGEDQICLLLIHLADSEQLQTLVAAQQKSGSCQIDQQLHLQSVAQALPHPPTKNCVGFKKVCRRSWMKLKSLQEDQQSNICLRPAMLDREHS